jgi:hypothetical protein
MVAEGMLMGAELWSYFVPYRDNIGEALEDLKQQEFAAGRYLKPARPHTAPSSIEEAVRACDASGTRSILDMIGVADSPRPIGFSLEDAFESGVDPGFGLVAPLAPEQLVEAFGTERPTRAMVKANGVYYEWIDRGLGIYIVVYDGDSPSELHFAGYSFD